MQWNNIDIPVKSYENILIGIRVGFFERKIFRIFNGIREEHIEEKGNKNTSRMNLEQKHSSICLIEQYKLR